MENRIPNGSKKDNILSNNARSINKPINQQPKSKIVPESKFSLTLRAQEFLKDLRINPGIIDWMDSDQSYDNLKHLSIKPKDLKLIAELIRSKNLRI